MQNLGNPDNKNDGFRSELWVLTIKATKYQMCKTFLREWFGMLARSVYVN